MPTDSIVRTGAVCLLAISSALMARDPEDEVDYGRLASLTLEELMAIQVTSVAGIEQDWFQTPAAMYVITGDEARRSGHRLLADTFRLAPGVFVGTINSHSRSVGTRGFNGGLANKTLVLIDGRSVYDPLFSGTFWDVQDILLEDLDRIEVIRGPGATLWGSNAVNGVFNVITRSSKDSQGLYLAGGGGKEDRAFGEMRYGGQLAENAWFRVWGKWTDHDNLTFGSGMSPSDPHDEWDMGAGGARFDIEDGEGGALMIDLGGYGTDRLGEDVRMPVPGAFLTFMQSRGDGRAEGGHILTRLSKDYDDGSRWSLQFYYDRTSRVQRAGFQAERDTADIEFRHHFHPLEGHELLWGVGYRYTVDHTSPSPELDHDPRSQERHTFSAFVQDTITICPDRLFFMIGSKFEHNDVTGFEIQPGVRLWWTPSDRQTLWGAISRSVRVPSRFEKEGILTLAYLDPFPPVQIVGDDGLRSEEMIAYEIGHRIRITPQLTVDTALFYNKYDNLIAVGPGILAPPPPFTHQFNNDGTGESYGGEVAVTWQIADNWRTVFAYSHTRVLIHGPVFTLDEFSTPRNMAQVRSYLDVTKDIELNAALYYVDTVPSPDADAYLRLDVGATWRITDNFELSAWGQNLTDRSHREFTAIEAQRAFYVMGTFRF
jgi:iron complex outermembrane recepter protein